MEQVILKVHYISKETYPIRWWFHCLRMSFCPCLKETSTPYLIPPIFDKEVVATKMVQSPGVSQISSLAREQRKIQISKGETGNSGVTQSVQQLENDHPWVDQRSI